MSWSALAELPLSTLRAIGHSLADVSEEEAPELGGAELTAALGAREIERDGFDLRHRRGI